MMQLIEVDFLLESWFKQILFITFFALLAHTLINFFFKQSKKIVEKTQGLWDDAILEASRLPAITLMWGLGVVFVSFIVNNHYDFGVSEYIHIVRTLIIVICVAWFAIKLVYAFTNNLVASKQVENNDLDRTTIDALSKLVRLIIIVLAVLITVQTMGFSISALLTAGGIGGIAIGFAAKDLLANFFGGLTIYLDRPFNVGDWVRSPDKNIEGTVEYISWRHTRIRGFNKNPIYVPNALFTSIVVENPSRMSHRRIKTNIGIRYADIKAMKHIVSDIKSMLLSHPDIDQNQTLIVNFNEFNASSIDIFIYTFTKTIEWVYFHEVKQDVLLKIANIVEANQAEIAFPTQTLHIENEFQDKVTLK